MTDRASSSPDRIESTDSSSTTIHTDDAPSSVIVKRVAKATGTDPLELPPLYDSVDPDALDRLVESVSSTGSVSFSYAGHSVQVDEDGTVHLGPD